MDNLLALWRRLPAAERARYPFALDRIPWRDYLWNTHLPGIRKCVCCGLYEGRCAVAAVSCKSNLGWMSGGPPPTSSTCLWLPRNARPPERCQAEVLGCTLIHNVTLVSCCRFLLDEDEEDWKFDNDSTLTVGRNF